MKLLKITLAFCIVNYLPISAQANFCLGTLKYQTDTGALQSYDFQLTPEFCVDSEYNETSDKYCLTSNTFSRFDPQSTPFALISAAKTERLAIHLVAISSGGLMSAPITSLNFTKRELQELTRHKTFDETGTRVPEKLSIVVSDTLGATMECYFNEK